MSVIWFPHGEQPLRVQNWKKKESYHFILFKSNRSNVALRRRKVT